MANRCWVIDGAGGGFHRREFFQHVRWLANRLPEADFALMLCDDRYNAMVSFVAVMVRGQTNLLPAGGAAQLPGDIVKDFPGAYRLVDRPRGETDSGNQFQVNLPDVAVKEESTEVEIPPDHMAAILYTSGSTGQPQPSPKRWSDLQRGAELTLGRLGFRRDESQAIVATVPPNHMFGLETSLLLPLIGHVGIFRGKPFYPKDIRRALCSVKRSRVLVTTPVHLGASVRSGLHWPACDLVLSATAPMPVALAIQAEALFQAPVMEIFGSTETGAIASRRSVEGDVWDLYEGVSIRPDKRGALVMADHLHRAARLNDRIELCGERGFRLHGRDTDMVKVGGKRGSLKDLSQKLNQIEGVLDGVFFVPPLQGRSAERLAAVVVAPALDKLQILSALARQIDPVFLPRPLVFADRLPRNETGKLPQDALYRVFEERSKNG